MHSVGPEPTTANAESADPVKSTEQPQQPSTQPPTEEPPAQTTEGAAEAISSNSSATNVIPTSPQYGVAIIPTTVTVDVAGESTTSSTDTVTETTVKAMDSDSKDMHSTPSRNDRFKVVKIASLEPFRRGRWKCMDYVDQTPPSTLTATKGVQSQGGQVTGTVYMQTQSLPQQHIQQMLIQGGYTSSPQFYQNVPNQVIPQTQYFYTTQNVPVQPQTLPQQISAVPQGAIQPQFINTSQGFFQANVVPNSAVFTLPNFQNVQYIPNQNSAFVPTSQNLNPQLPPNFQQSQTYAGSASSQTNVAQPLVNGHPFPTPSEQQVVASSLPTQTAKNLILNNVPQSLTSNQTNPSSVQNPVQSNIPIQSSQQSQSVPLQNLVQSQTFSQQLQAQQLPQNVAVVNQALQAVNTQNSQSPQGLNQIQTNQGQSSTAPQSSNSSQGQSVVTQITPVPIAQVIQVPSNIAQSLPVQVQAFDPSLPTNVYTNPQFVASVNSVPNVEGEGKSNENHIDGNNDSTSDNASGDDPTKANPVVNAIDNKIEQAMDLVKSHLMYTVREEVEVLKEKIAELMERIQQLESENNFLRSQLPKTQQNGTSNGTPDPPQ